MVYGGVNAEKDRVPWAIELSCVGLAVEENRGGFRQETSPIPVLGCLKEAL